MPHTERTLFTNCTIITNDSAWPRAGAMVVQDGRVVGVGNENEIVEPGDRRVDLEGGTVVAGFDDCHMHVLSAGLMLRQLDVSSSRAPTISSIKAAVEQRAYEAEGEAWILGRGYNQNLLGERRHPNRHDLDPVSMGRPVGLVHTSGHVMTVNSLSLQLAGIDGNTEDPLGGEIERDESGDPTGVLKEAAIDLVRGIIPKPSVSQARDAILQASQQLAREGITSASDAATGQHAGLEQEVQAYGAAAESGELQTRIVLMPLIQELDEAGQDGLQPPGSLGLGDEPEWLRVGPTKIFSDGALTTRTAALMQPYDDVGGTGILTWPVDELEAMIAKGHRAGWQIATHAIGDRAVDAVLTAYERAQRAMSRSDTRHRIEHCTIADESLVDRIGRLRVVVVLQPEDIAVLGDAYRPALGSDRAADNSPVGWFDGRNVPIAFSSDRPVTPGHPLMGVRAAVERKTASGILLGPHHRVAAEAAVRYYTAGSAYATFTEDIKGSLRPGYCADFVVFSRDITSCVPEEITAARILMTVVDGSPVYQSD